MFYIIWNISPKIVYDKPNPYNQYCYCKFTASLLQIAHVLRYVHLIEAFSPLFLKACIFSKAWDSTTYCKVSWVTSLMFLFTPHLKPDLVIRIFWLYPVVFLNCKLRSLGSMYISYSTEKSTFNWACSKTPWYLENSSATEKPILINSVNVLLKICFASNGDAEVFPIPDLAWTCKIRAE